MIFLTCVSNAISKDASSIIRWDESLLKITRTAWAVFKYCGTKTVPLRMKK